MSSQAPTIQQLIINQGYASGLTVDQIEAALAVNQAEGINGVGDNGTSFGPFQFHIGGVLGSFWQWLGQRFGSQYNYLNTITDVGNFAVSQPQLAVQFALEPGGYLYQAIKQGTAAGKTGPDLAYYAEEYGQRSISSGWQLAYNAWTSLFGPGGSGTSWFGDSSPAGPPAPAPGSPPGGIGPPAPTVNCPPNNVSINTPLGTVTIPLPDVGCLATSLATDIGTTVGNATTALQQTANSLITPTVTTLGNINSFLTFLENPQTTSNALMLAFGAIITIVGVFLFALSLMPKDFAKNLPVPVPV